MTKKDKDGILNSEDLKALKDAGVDTKQVVDRIEELMSKLTPTAEVDPDAKNLSNIEHFLPKAALERWIGIKMLHAMAKGADKERMELLVGLCCCLVVDLLTEYALGKASKYKSGGDFVKDFFLTASQTLSKEIDAAYLKSEEQEEKESEEAANE